MSPDEAVVAPDEPLSRCRAVPGQEIEGYGQDDRSLVDRFLLDGHYASEGDVVILVAGHPIAAEAGPIS